MQKKSRSTRWVNYFKSVGLQPELIEAYLPYIKRMSKENLPVIFEFHHLSKLLGRTPYYLASAVNVTEYHYRTFSIPKKSGGKRTISVPYPALLLCQQWIKSNILYKARIHDAAHGFVNGRSIKSNAELHLRQKHLLKMDLRDFFPSITKKRIINVFIRMGYPQNVSFYLASLCCLDEKLPQGAPTSPVLSNVVAHGMDVRLSKLAEKSGLTYTRYADDLTFSGEKIGIGILEIIADIAKSEGFEVNQTKTRLCRTKGRRIVTGISVSEDEMKVPRNFKRKLRQEVHYIRIHGYKSHISKLRVREPFYIYSLIGKLSFWQWIEPDNDYCSEALMYIRGLIENG